MVIVGLVAITVACECGDVSVVREFPEAAARSDDAAAEAGSVTDSGPNVAEGCPEAAAAAEGVSYGLDPTADCVHPPVECDCVDGWCRIPAGCFIYGSAENVACRGLYTEQQVQVTLTHSFLMAETEVTQAQWEAVGFANPSRELCADCALAWVDWYEALVYCNALSERAGLEPCYDLFCCEGEIGGGCPPGDEVCAEDTNYQCDCEVVRHANPYECPGYRLPSGAEWEYAARAGTRSDTYNGDLNLEENPGCVRHPVLDPIAWYCANSGKVVQPVRGKQPNCWGLYDMLGNVAEWVSDWATGSSLEQNVGEDGPLVDPIYTYRTEANDTRGYGVIDETCTVRAARGRSLPASWRTIELGLRPVRTLF